MTRTRRSTPLLRPALVLATATLTALLSACSSTDTVGVRAPTAISGAATAAELTTLTISAPLGAAAVAGSIQPQGIVFNDDGTAAVTVRVRVYIGERLIRFDNNNNAVTDGNRDFITLTQGQSSATVRLPPGVYSFVAAGVGADATGTLLAYGLSTAVRVDDTSPKSVTLPLHTLIGGEVGVSLTSDLPTTYLVIGQNLDLVLKVMSPIASAKAYTVPLDDFEVSYSDDPSGSITASSKLGARLNIKRVQTGTTSYTARAAVTGFGADSPGTASRKTFTATFTRPLYAQAALGADLKRPDLVACRLVLKGENSPTSLVGSLGDNVGVRSLELYEGPVLAASTFRGAGVQKITIEDKAFNSQGCLGQYSNFSVDVPPATDTARVLTLIAHDTSGNETRLVFNLPARAY